LILKLKELIDKDGSHNGYEIQEGQLIVTVWHASSSLIEKNIAKKLAHYLKDLD
jgi:hypothetical protein